MTEKWIHSCPNLETLRTQDHYQSAVNFQRRSKSCNAVTQEDVYCITALLSVVLKLCSNNHVQICDSVYSNLPQTLKTFIHVFYRNFSRDNADVMVT